MRTYLPDMATITFIKVDSTRQFTQNVNEGILFIRSGLSLFGLELLSNLVYGIQAAFSVDCSSSCLPSLKMTLLTTKVNKLNP